ncbi:MAG: siroheme synthase [Desulfuromonas sp.]|nr:MAG: siroheme synthase [Desulfuromonas sp.]
MPCSESSRLPLLLQFDGRKIVVVGGGRAGQRKLETLLAAGANVQVIAGRTERNEFPPEVEVVRRDFVPSDLDGVQLAFAATDDTELNAFVVAEAHKRGILCSRADQPTEGDFILPAIRRQGELTIAVSTGGASPSLAALLADEIFENFGPEWKTLLQITAALRRQGLTSEDEIPYNREVLRQLLTHGLVDQLKAGDLEAAERTLGRICGSRCTFNNLGIRLPEAKQ